VSSKKSWYTARNFICDKQGIDSPHLYIKERKTHSSFLRGWDVSDLTLI
jgi:hypothetical protein